MSLVIFRDELIVIPQENSGRRFGEPGFMVSISIWRFPCKNLVFLVDVMIAFN
jgi:hypothetical protein